MLLAGSALGSVSGRRQLFIVDDAFGSTRYRPEGAERWAQALGRLLEELDDDHWLISTSRPAPLKAGLGRVRREPGSARFPAPGDVLVDASDLDLAEDADSLSPRQGAPSPPATRELVRAWGLTISSSIPHFTPERIRRLVADRIEVLADPTRGLSVPRAGPSFDSNLPRQQMRCELPIAP